MQNHCVRLIQVLQLAQVHVFDNRPVHAFAHAAKVLIHIFVNGVAYIQVIRCSKFFVCFCKAVEYAGNGCAVYSCPFPLKHTSKCGHVFGNFLVKFFRHLHALVIAAGITGNYIVKFILHSTNTV